MPDNTFPPLEDLDNSLEGLLDSAWLSLNDLTINPYTRYYLHTALDLRFFIERLLSIALKISTDGKLSKSKSKIYRPNDYGKSISIEKVNEAISRLNKKELTFPNLDIRELNSIYGQLGNYLHAPKSDFAIIDDDEWKTTLESAVLSAYEYLKHYKHYDYLEVHYA